MLGHVVAIFLSKVKIPVPPKVTCSHIILNLSLVSNILGVLLRDQGMVSFLSTWRIAETVKE